ncbi:MAG: hypothetical protein DRK00_08610 [Thermoprotei archaeon]|nr:MAG: hypothetical protein DRK00_08610 [Thermoprotei archaeon]
MPSEKKRRPAFRLSKYLDSLSYPVGTAMSVNFKRLGRDMDLLFLEEPAEFYRLLIEVYSGDEESAIFFLRLLAGSLTEKTGLYVDPVEFAEAVKRGDKAKLHRILEAVSRAQRL